jgi:ATP-dependent DNA helicase RecG
MTRTDLLDMIANGENSRVEFKRDTIENRSLAKELVALANFNGGRVLLGVEDGGSIVGLTRPDLEQWVMNACRDKIRPEIIPNFEIIRDVDAGNDVAVLGIERGFNVHSVWHNQHRTYYIRVGSQSRDADTEELARLFQQRGTIHAETQPVSGSSIIDLDLRRLSEYFKVIRQQETPDLEDEQAWIPLLINTEFLVQGDGVTPANIAGLLLFGRNPNRLLLHAGIDAAVYPGSEKDYNSSERSFIRGAMVRLSAGANILENGLWEAAQHFLQRHVSREGINGEGVRVRTWDYPAEVLREAIVNALVHRDYLLSATTIELSVYADRLEVVSPGRPPNGVTMEGMKLGCRSARNQLLNYTMRDYGYMEHMGMGIPRKIIRGMRAHNGTEPEFIADPDGERFVLRLWK